ncbi:MAG: hypothetical protein KUL82_10730 [Bdellovibrio sp.]|nr:hypothetical protein [Bdellovibrio sp.]
MKTHKRKTEGHIQDADRTHPNPSYQSKKDRQNMRQSEDRNATNFKREDLGFSHRDTRGYDKQHKEKY